MKNLTTLTSAIILCANTAFALSCAPPNVTREFNWHAERKETYQIGVGTITATEEIKIPKRAENDIGVPYTVKATFTGKILGLRGLGEEAEFPILVKINCLAHWCGAFPEESKTTITFLEQTPKIPSITYGPCAGFGPTENIKKETRILQKCLRNGKCSEAQINSLNTF